MDLLIGPGGAVRSLYDEAIRLLVEHGTYLVPTIWIGDYYIQKGSPSGMQDKMVELSKKYRTEPGPASGRPRSPGAGALGGASAGIKPVSAP